MRMPVKAMLMLTTKCIRLWRPLFDSDSQDNLTAITVNNVFGFNQVANGTNISGGAVSATDGIGGSASSTTAQANISQQNRGAPIGLATFANLSVIGKRAILKI